MKKSIDNYIKAIAYDNAEYITSTIAEYIIYNEEQGGDWHDFFDDSELEDGEPTSEQIEEVKEHLNKYYNYKPE